VAMALPTALLWPAKLPSAPARLAVAAAGVMCTGVAYVLFFRIIANAGPARALSATFLVPVFAVLYGAVLIGETVTLWMVLCALVIVCGTALATGLLRLGRHTAT
jgi:drug/metabolite transporter (DMT)-like permease